MMGDTDQYSPIKVSISQFYGIEINDFAVTVARTALWIAESQMMKETEDIIKAYLEFFPIDSNAKIVEGNALRMDWEDIVPKHELDYIMGNPPFVGTKYQNKTQKADLLLLSQELKKLDYVVGWYFKADSYIKNTSIKCSFVSTNSITQGEQVAPLAKLMNSQIIFAHETFKWNSEASQKASVHCVITGFSNDFNGTRKIIYDNFGRPKVAKNINAYLLDAPNVLVEKRTAPIYSGAPKMIKGSQPTDGGYLILSNEEKVELTRKYPQINHVIRRYMGATDLINNKYRYCLWLEDVEPKLYRHIPEIRERLNGVKISRENSTKLATQKWASRPFLFTENRQPKTDYLMIPVVSSENRRYIPIGYVDKDVIANTNAQMIPDADLYTFGILNSNVHNSWMRVTCGRMKSDYAYSISIVYNNFPWPSPTEIQKGKIEKTAQDILDARKLYPESSLADLYDELTMPPELRKAHQENDKAVMDAYDFDWRKMTGPECVAELLRMYQELTGAK